MMVSEQSTRQLRLSDLLAGLVVPDHDVSVAGLASRSDEVRPGSLFLAYQGLSTHGLAHVDEAIRAGAAAVAWEPAPGIAAPVLPDSVAGVVVPGLRQQLGVIADRFFGQPSRSLHIAGVTGTNGKTTCTFLLAQALEQLGQRCGLLGTLGAGSIGSLVPSGHTTPDAIEVHRQLAGFRDRGFGHVAMEVSSHALDQHRIGGVSFDVAVFTNLSREHLDYHGDLESYRRAKARLFGVQDLKHAVINVDDSFGAELTTRLREGTGWTAVTADSPDHASFVQILGVVPRSSGLSVRVATPAGQGELRSRLIGHFNAVNLSLALGVLLYWEFPLVDALVALERADSPPGRMQKFGGEEGLPLVLVDYAHTPDALANALRTARDHSRGEIWCVFGCGGERDAGKRPKMGNIARRYAKHVVVTDDNPRGEDPTAIIKDVLAGIEDQSSVCVQRDRATAIQTAIQNAAADDVVVIAGKGHEEHQITAGERRWFSDAHEVMRTLARLALGPSR